MAKVEVKSDFVRSVNHKDAVETIKTMYNADVPMMMWGAPGIGKSVTVIETAKSIAGMLGLEFIEWNALSTAERNALANSLDNKGKFIYGDCRLSQYDPSDWALPWVDRENEDSGMKWLPSQLLKAYSVPGTKGMLFLDELPQATPSVQNAAYQIILDRQYKDVCFKGIRMVAAGNRSSDGGNQYAFAPALANRLCHVELNTPSSEDWVKWARDNGVHPMICAFIKSRPDCLYEETGKTENRRYAWASPRSWEMVSKLLNAMPPMDAANREGWVSDAYYMLHSTVGKGAALEFQAFMLTLHDVFLEDYLKNPELLKDASIDIQLGVQAMLEAHAINVINKGDDKETIKLIDQHFNIFEANLRNDIKAIFLSSMLRVFRQKDGNIAGKQVIVKLLEKHKKKDMLSKFKGYVNELIYLLTGQRIS